jgi:hypothetical protein
MKLTESEIEIIKACVEERAKTLEREIRTRKDYDLDTEALCSDQALLTALVKKLDQLKTSK